MNYCVSDIHGCSKTLRALLRSISLTPTDTVYFLGDYVDRGPDSKGVLDIVMGMPNAICLKGNHEDMMLKALEPTAGYDTKRLWMENGGEPTLKSFGYSVNEKYLHRRR